MMPVQLAYKPSYGLRPYPCTSTNNVLQAIILPSEMYSMPSGSTTRALSRSTLSRPMEENDTTHAAIRQRSYANLAAARSDALKHFNYSLHSRACMQSVFTQKFGKPAHDWQLDTAEAILLKMDTVLIAGTGSGKTIPFMLPLLLEKRKLILVISPLKILQHDMAGRFTRMGIKAAAVNGDTWKPRLRDRILQGRYQAMFVGPEMCLEHVEFRKTIQAECVAPNLLGIIVDEAHCISQWGGDFRTQYSRLDRLRSLFPPATPVLAASATLCPDALREVRRALIIDADTSFHLNLGNDRPNIATSVRRMKNSTDFKALRSFINTEATSCVDIPKTLVFGNSINTVQAMCKKVRSWLHPSLHQHARYIHALLSSRARRRIMKRFRTGQVLLLFATEVAGMGADIPDILTAIQFGIPSSLSVLKQRIGRAGRSPEIQAKGIVLVEESMFKQRNRQKKAVNDSTSCHDLPANSDTELFNNVGVDDEDSGVLVDEGSVEAISEGKEWCKQVDPVMRRWITSSLCERDVADDYFGNPPDRKAPTGDCCDRRACPRANAGVHEALNTPLPPVDDNNIQSGIPDLSYWDDEDDLPDPANMFGDENSRPATPPADPLACLSAHSTLSKSTNENGKRSIVVVRSSGPKTRRGDHRKEAEAALDRWRFKTHRRLHNPSPFPSTALLPDFVLKQLASRCLRSTEELNDLNPRWLRAEEYGAEVLSLLQRLDTRVATDAAAKKKARSDERKLQTRLRRDADKQAKKLAREEAKAAKQRQRINEAAARRALAESQPSILLDSRSYNILHTPMRDSSTSFFTPQASSSSGIFHVYTPEHFSPFS
ncbi:hypothetical protein AB1N83_012918 [Pleurotus pulmonarius]